MLAKLTLPILVLGLCAVALGPTMAKPQPSFDVLGVQMTVLVDAAQTNGVSATLRMSVPPGGGPPAHIHTREDETDVVMRGHFRFWRSAQTIDAMPGTVVFLPRNTAHQWRNVGTTAGEMIMTVTPGHSRTSSSKSANGAS